MITGELKSRTDRSWDAFWAGGISNPLEVIEQIMYLLFLRRLDEQQTLAEKELHWAKSTSEPMPFAGQHAFAAKAAAVRIERDRVAGTLAADDDLFAALQHRAFRGEL